MGPRESAEQIVRTLRDAGFAAYFAGGCVRDMIMGRECHDYDIATSARPEDVARLFPKCRMVGAAFGVAQVKFEGNELEVATFRADGPYLDGRRPSSVTFCSPREDVMRRDFTINGMLYDPIEDKVIDYVDGRDDIDRKVVRTIGESDRRFAEDRLRMLRAVRFAAALDFSIEKETYDAIISTADRIAEVSAERIRDELLKVITLPEGGGARGLRLLHDTGLLKHIAPEVAEMEGVEQPLRYHPEGDVFEHTCKMLEMARSPSPELAMGILLHDIGKPSTQTFEERIRFDSHDRVGAEIARQVCQRLRLSREQTEHIADLVAHHMRICTAPHMRPSKLKKLLALPRFREHLELHRLDCLASHRKLDRYEFLERMTEEMSKDDISPPPLIDGHDLRELGYAPGPRYSQILNEVREKQLDGELNTKEDAIEFVKNRFPLKERR